MGKAVARYYMILVLFFLIGVTMFSVFQYISSLKEKYGLLGDLNKAKEELGVFGLQKQNLLQTIEKAKELQRKLSQENLGLTNTIKANEEELTKLKTDSIRLNSVVEELNSQNSLLKTENMALREDTDKLIAQISRVSQENEKLKERLSSIAELKKAIIEFKKQARKVNGSIRKEAKMEGNLGGNAGFILKDGAFTYPTKVKIEVIPVQANN